MKSNTNNKAAQKQRRIGALERLRVNLKEKTNYLSNPPKDLPKTLPVEEYKANISEDIKRINKEITILEERVKL